ncbi:MAG TPA: neutral zinc metallopeptidase [Candidatus Limnocylindria bacterium]
MSFDESKPLDPSQVEDQRGGRGGGTLVVGGGALGLIILVAALLLGVDPFEGQAPSAYPVDGGPNTDECKTGADANRRDDCRIVGFVDSIQKYWTDELARRSKTYTPARTVLYTGATQAGCGLATSAAGPFYCPTDQKVYLDLAFFEELRTRFGATGGPFAEGYVVAHEYGHHVQHVLGLLSEGGGPEPGPQGTSVRTELQADCFAGVWARHASDTGFLAAPSAADIATALDAAAAVGDDRIQRSTQGRVDPEKWTHGSAQQRQQWFRVGYDGGDFTRCDPR